MQASSVSFNPVLTTLAVSFMHNSNEFVGQLLAPYFITGVRSADFPKCSVQNALNIPKNIERAPSTPFSRSQSVLEQDTFHCRTRGHEEPVDDEVRATYSNSFSADDSAANRISDIITINHEIDVHALATGGSVPSSTPTVKWDAASATIMKDVNVAREANWKVYVVMALLAGAKVPDVAAVLASLDEEARR